MKRVLDLHDSLNFIRTRNTRVRAMHSVHWEIYLCTTYQFTERCYLTDESHSFYYFLSYLENASTTFPITISEFDGNK